MQDSSGPGRTSWTWRLGVLTLGAYLAWHVWSAGAFIGGRLALAPEASGRFANEGDRLRAQLGADYEMVQRVAAAMPEDAIFLCEVTEATGDLWWVLRMMLYPRRLLTKDEFKQKQRDGGLDGRPLFLLFVPPPSPLPALPGAKLELSGPGYALFRQEGGQ